MAVVRERRLAYYNIAFVPLSWLSWFVFLNNKSLNQNTRLPSYGCYQRFAPFSFVVAMLDDISSPPSRSVPTYLCTFCTQLFCYLNEDILISKIV